MGYGPPNGFHPSMDIIMDMDQALWVDLTDHHLHGIKQLWARDDESKSENEYQKQTGSWCWRNQVSTLKRKNNGNFMDNPLRSQNNRIFRGDFSHQSPSNSSESNSDSGTKISTANHSDSSPVMKTIVQMLLENGHNL
ncbi:hypothetical protein Btru_059590 [Bulinus truncatus]|nr:hypothetical protein Btru_059590 [Bulinus truncatus]